MSDATKSGGVTHHDVHTAEFFRALYGDLAGQALLINKRKPSPTATEPDRAFWDTYRILDVDKAARGSLKIDEKAGEGEGIFHRITTVAPDWSPDCKLTSPRCKKQGSCHGKHRGSARESTFSPGIFLDIDIRHAGHVDQEKPETWEAFEAVLDAAQAPALSVLTASSGAGFYPGWLHPGLVEVDYTEYARVQKAIHYLITTWSKHLGMGKVDSTFDLARVLRIPGTHNRKPAYGPDYPICRVIRLDTPRYSLADLAEWVKGARLPGAARSAASATADGDALFDNASEILMTSVQATQEITRHLNTMATCSGEMDGQIGGAARRIGKLCAAGAVSESQARQSMTEAIGRNGTSRPDFTMSNADWAESIIDRAFTAGMQQWWDERPFEIEAATGQDEQRATPGAILPSPGQPLHVARELIGRLPASDGVPHRAWWRDDFYTWTGAHWEVTEAPEIERWLYQQTGDAVYFGGKEGQELLPWAPTKGKIITLAHALGVGELQRVGEADQAMAAANGVIRGRVLTPHAPSRFNLFSLPFAYDPAAHAPAWQTFLDQVLPDDRQSQDFLGEWFGYVLAGRTEQQKMAALVGKKRSGKGTIARVLAALVGKDAVCGLNLGTLGGTFGLEPFIGAALAVASDVRWQSRTIGDAVQILLEVSGEDHVTVNRKNKAAWKGTLGTRFMLMSNDTPTFSDRSGALVDRMIYVSFRQSFFGREDTGLTEKLMHELPGILNWALDGLDRLDGRGCFTQPESGKGEMESTRRLADPIGAFIEDWCQIGPSHAISLDHLFVKYQSWCLAEGRTKDTTTKEIFSRDIRAKVDGLRSKRARSDGKFMTMFYGIGSDAI